MLACMPQSPHSLTKPHTNPTATSTMSLAILPSSPATYNQTPILSAAPSASKRPKLSLNTSILPPTFGKKTTSLRLETLSATSPTVRNTFSNAHEEDARLRAASSRAKRPTLSNLATSSTTAQDIISSSPVAFDHLESTASSTTSANSISTTDSLPTTVPYKLTYNATSILTNSPLPRPSTQRRTFAQSKPMFPTAKKVAFAAPLTEEITTERYTMRHSDIESSISTISTLELSPPETDKLQVESEGDALKSGAKVLTKKSRSSSPRTGEKRESSDEEDSDTCPATPVAGRKKRHREWVWTLGPTDTTSISNDKPRIDSAGIGEQKVEGA